MFWITVLCQICFSQSEQRFLSVRSLSSLNSVFRRAEVLIFMKSSLGFVFLFWNVLLVLSPGFYLLDVLWFCILHLCL